ncbi:PREDICTED: uncharacterized protein LOC107354411 [Acropora digitifera]|uniref:uncharacterized protein LOC107354411 n=1 Tax=Acropora digitifera TaxID=70779 RepID=UPI00077A2FFE|nr:PREDICTED: uncharacterized protein LOC107354411 [Acropora digitifera]
MADDWKGKVTRDPFPEIPGMPNRNELMKPLIFPNSQRGFKIFTVVATISACIYCIFVPEYKGDHIFLPVRKWVHDQKGRLLKIRPEDEEYVNRRTAELASKAEMAAKQTYQDSAKEMAKSS